MRKIFTGILAAVVAVTFVTSALAQTAESQSQYDNLHKSKRFMFLHGQVFINGAAANAGDEVAVYSDSGVLCGTGTIKKDGILPAIPIYKDDPRTDIVDGAKPGQTLYFAIWDADRKNEYHVDEVAVEMSAETDNTDMPTWTYANDVVRVKLLAPDKAHD